MKIQTGEKSKEVHFVSGNREERNKYQTKNERTEKIAKGTHKMKKRKMKKCHRNHWQPTDDVRM